MPRTARQRVTKFVGAAARRLDELAPDHDTIVASVEK